ncbi:MAG: LTA synthase family protein [Rhodospirillales bacterium]|nr:LTA synthase family protein [Alphaproteobacteria bacterium]USO03704.1 MAG: LTA synthase family protein [Rhodospirillales bacterium]
MNQSRFSIAMWLYIVTLASFILVRGLFLALSLNVEDFSAGDLAFIFGVGWIYDTAYCLYALILPALYLLLMPQRWWGRKWNARFLHFLIFAVIFVTGFSAVAEYLFWEEFTVRFNFIAVDYLVYRREVTNNIMESYPIPLLLFVLFLVSLAVYWPLRGKIEDALDTEEPFTRRAGVALGIGALTVLSFILVGQGLRDNQPSTYVRELASSGPYQLIASFQKNELDYEQFYAQLPEEEAASVLRKELAEKGTTFLKPEGLDIRRKIYNPGREKRLNIMLVMIESLSSDFMGSFGEPHGLTPSLDALGKKGIFFENLYATGTRTTRGLEAVTLSIPPTPGRSIVKRTGREKNMWSFGSVLREKGYDVRFLYGGYGYFDNMNEFFGGNGYDVVDRSDMADEDVGFENAWGVADEYLYDHAIKVARKADEEGKPFFFHLMTTSNHRPYTYPEGRIDIPSGENRWGGVKYTDWAIGDFIEKAGKEKWFDNTVFVFVADHTAGSAGKRDLPVSFYHIPMIVYAPRHFRPRRVETLMSQIDIAPSLLALLDMDYESAFFGRNIFKTSKSAQRTLVGNYQNLGYYTPGELTILSPKQKITQFQNPQDDVPQEREVPDEDHLKKAQSYYQGASLIYKRRLNAYPPEEEAKEK